MYTLVLVTSYMGMICRIKFAPINCLFEQCLNKWSSVNNRTISVSKQCPKKIYTEFLSSYFDIYLPFPNKFSLLLHF